MGAQERERRGEVSCFGEYQRELERCSCVVKNVDKKKWIRRRETDVVERTLGICPIFLRASGRSSITVLKSLK
jgi:hypothetical protein